MQYGLDRTLTLQIALEDFYKFYNFERIHGSTLNLPPATFWQQWKVGNIERVLLDEKKRKVKFTLKIQRQQICLVKPAGNENQREVFVAEF